MNIKNLLGDGKPFWMVGDLKFASPIDANAAARETHEPKRAWREHSWTVTFTVEAVHGALDHEGHRRDVARRLAETLEAAASEIRTEHGCPRDDGAEAPRAVLMEPKVVVVGDKMGATKEDTMAGDA